MNEMFVPSIGTIRDIADETSDIRTLTIGLDEHGAVATLPGQFVEFTVFGFGEFPVSVSGTNENGDCIQTTIQEKGKATAHIAGLKPGDSIGIRGPFGNGYPLDLMVGKDVYIVTGGIGLAAVWLLIDSLAGNRDKYGNLTLLHGARCMEDMIYKNSFVFDDGRAARMGITVATTVDVADSCWEGNVGLVTSLFDQIDVDSKNAYTVVCGPEVMMKAACRDLMKRGFQEDQLILSMERRMQCGTGTCGHCMVGQKRVCIDGPVFKYSEIKTGLQRMV
jgi:NAD(P)H-flavin reductase